MKRKHVQRLGALLAVVALAGAACSDSDDGGVVDDGGDGEAGVATLDVTATDDAAGAGYAFEVDAEVPAGATQISLENTGGEAHHAQIYKLNEGTTLEDVGAALAAEDIPAILAAGAFTSGTATIDPGSSSSAEAIVDLTEGTYAFMCFVMGPNGPHVANGMLQEFEVVANEEPAGVPEGDVEVSLIDFGYELPDEISGSATLTVTNDTQSGMELHEMNMALLGEGATADDVASFFAGEAEGPPTFSGKGGIQALMPTASGTLALDLEPGEYALFCLIPSADGVPHIAKGMLQTITVT